MPESIVSSSFRLIQHCILLVLLLFLFERADGQENNGSEFCSGFQFSLGGTNQDRAYDIAISQDNNFFVTGVTKSFGNGDQILISKLTENGTVLWSRTYGGSRNELVRKVKSTTDGGLLIIGQTTSFNYAAGEILCFKINQDGNLLWTRKFGVNSPFGDLGMDIIETSDGGYALTGIINVAGMFADMTVIRLNNTADIVWAKRFDRGDGEDGVGIVQKGDTLVIASDLMNANSHYELHLMKLKLSDGSFITSKKLTPSQSGLFNPYLYKNPFAPGYIVSGHTINFSSYNQMNHTILSVDDEFEIVDAKLIRQTTYTNDHFTGFIPMSDGSFIGCASPMFNPDAYIYRIQADNTISFSKRFNNSNDRRLSRLEVLNDKVIAVGAAVHNNNEDFYVTAFETSGVVYANCDLEDVPLTIERPLYSVNPFQWPTISNINFVNASVSIVSSAAVLQKTMLCLTYDRTPLQTKSICEGESIQLQTSSEVGNLWSDGSTGTAITVADEGIYWVKSLQAAGCYTIDSFRVLKKALPIINLGADTTICASESITLDAGNAGAVYSWNNGQTSQKVNVRDAGLYFVSVNANGCIGKDSILLSLLPVPQLNIRGEKKICRDGFTELSAEGALNYSWSPAASLSSPTGAVTVAKPLSTTTYYIKGTGSNGCIASDSVEITVLPKPEFKAHASVPVLCAGDTAVLTAFGGDRYIWSPALSLSDPMNNTTLAYPRSNTRYKVVIEENGCKITDSLFVELKVASKPAVTTTKSNDINCFVGQATLSTTGGVQYLWQPAIGLSDSTSSRPVVSISSTTTYHVFVTTNEGCTVKDSITVAVSKDEGTGYLVPSAFTPNGDGKNDCFGVKFWGEVRDFSMQLYNRWGELVFQTNDPVKCWNGYYKGLLQPDGAYVFMIKAKTMCGNVFRKGSFLLIR